MAMTSGALAPRIFDGWWVAMALAIIVPSSGIRFTIGPFLKPVTADLGLNRGSFSLVVAVSLFLYGGFMPLVGRSSSSAIRGCSCWWPPSGASGCRGAWP